MASIAAIGDRKEPHLINTRREAAEIDWPDRESSDHAFRPTVPTALVFRDDDAEVNHAVVVLTVVSDAAAFRQNLMELDSHGLSFPG
jgi:hypothetical protein